MRCTPAEKMFPRRAARRPSGLTLMELVVSMIATSALLVGMSSAVFLASRASRPGSTASGVIEASLTAGQIATELGSARSVTEYTLTSIAFTVADRDSDGKPELIRYAWPANLGAPLTRQYNQGPVVEVLDNVYGFVLKYHTESIQLDPNDPVKFESAEQLLAGFDTVGNVQTYDVKDNFWPGQFFKPFLSADVVHWRVTRVEVVLKKETAGQLLHVQLRPITAGNVPATSVLAEVIVNSDSVADLFAWRSFSFNNVSGLHPDQALYLVLTDGGAGFPAKLKGLDTALPAPGLSLVTSDNQGAS